MRKKRGKSETQGLRISAVMLVGIALAAVGTVLGLVESHGKPVGGYVGLAVGIAFFVLIRTIMR